MAKRLAFLFALAAILSGIVSPISITKPISAEITDGAMYDLGNMGPGQAMSILIERTETTGGKYGTGGYYDLANASDLPEGWSATPSKLYENPLQVIIVSGPNATQGNYMIPIRVYDENNGEGLGTRMFFAAIHVDYDVLGLSKIAGTSYAGEGQPVRYTMKLQNRGNAGDIFVIEAYTYKQKVVRELYMAPASEVIVPFEFIYDGSGVQGINFTAYSKNSPLNVRQGLSYQVAIKNTIQADMSSMGYGVVLFPLFEHGSYALGHIFSYLLG
jgi:hypothetical protein